MGTVSPVIALDVDGVFAPWLNPEHGPMLSDLADDLGAELVWATAWNHEANRWVAPEVGLPSLRVVDMTGAMPHRARDTVHWKVPYLAAWVGDRPLAWLDDEFEPADFRWAEERALVCAPTLLVPVDDRAGLNSGHLSAIRAWGTT